MKQSIWDTFTQNNQANKASSGAGGSIEGTKLHLYSIDTLCLVSEVLFTSVFHSLGGELSVLSVMGGGAHFSDEDGVQSDRYFFCNWYWILVLCSVLCFPSTVCRATSLSLLHHSLKPQVIFWAYSGHGAVFLLRIRCPLCVWAGDLSHLNHRVTFSFPPQPQVILFARLLHPPQFLSKLFCSFFSIPSHLPYLFAERRPGSPSQTPTGLRFFETGGREVR